MEKLTADDIEAMKACIAILLAKGGSDAALIQHELTRSGFEQAGHTASTIVQSDTLKLKPWQTPPCDPWGRDCREAIELRRQLLAHKISIYVADPKQALADVADKSEARVALIEPMLLTEWQWSDNDSDSWHRQWPLPEVNDVILVVVVWLDGNEFPPLPEHHPMDSAFWCAEGLGGGRY